MIEQIKADFKTARIARDTTAVNLLSTLVGDIENLQKNGKTVDVVALLKKYVDGIDVVESNAGKTDITIREREILNRYIPTQLTVEQIKELLQQHNITDRGNAQKYMKQNHAGQYNGADVNKALGL